MLASILIMVFCAVMCLYWCRYTCLLLLEPKSTTRQARRMAAVNGLSFVNVQAELNGSTTPASLDHIEQALARDYRVLMYLLHHASNLDTHSSEHKLLMLDYRVMQLWYRLVKPFAPVQARRAVAEMSGVLTYFAGAIGERVASFS